MGSESEVFCPKCARSLVEQINYCPHCGYSFMGASFIAGNDDTTNIVERAPSHIKNSLFHIPTDLVKKLLLGKIRGFIVGGALWGMAKIIVRYAVVFFMTSLLISVLYGGDWVRWFNAQAYDFFTRGAEKMEGEDCISSASLLVNWRDGISGWSDEMAERADSIGVIKKYIELKKEEKEREGEKTAEEIRKLKDMRDLLLQDTSSGGSN